MRRHLPTSLYVLPIVLIAMLTEIATGAEESAATWTADPAVVEANSKRSPAANYSEEQLPPYTLPDPLVAADGTRVTKETWPARRAEILDLFRQHVYGRAPVDKPQGVAFTTVEEDASDLGGRATRRLVEISFDTPHAGRFKFPVQIYLPNAATRPMPVVVLLQFQGLTDAITPQLIDRGYALAILDRNGVAADDKEEYRKGVINAFSGDGPLAADAWRTIAAWAWGASRVVDYLETEPAIDCRRISVAGHSRMGKTALWAGATDERFAAVLSNNSGCGGAALARRIFGETVGRINTVFPHWFCENHHRYNDREADLPVDQHMLLALIAPRAVYVTSADEDLWADPRGEFLSCVHADPVYQLLGVAGLGTQEMPSLERPLISGPIGYHVRRGRHAFTEYDWQRFLDFESNASQAQ
jgi:dienelactone hydrolase